MPRVKVKPKGRKPREAPAFEDLGQLDQLFIQRAANHQNPRPEWLEGYLAGAPGHSVGTWLASEAGKDYLRRFPPPAPEPDDDGDPLGARIRARQPVVGAR